MLKMREVAMESFIKQTTMEAIKRAARRRPRVRRDFNPGETVYVYRRMLARKSLQVASDTKRPQWIGPGTVIVNEGPNVWVSMRVEVWKCAKEQVRPATNEEEEAYGLLREELEDLREEINRRGSKRGFKDISCLSFPLEEEDAAIEAEEPPEQRRRLEEPEREETADASGAEGGEAQAEESSSSSTSVDGTEEPEGERISEAHMDASIRSSLNNEALDGTLRTTPQEAYGPQRRRLEAMRFKPYHFFVNTETEDAEDEEKEGKDVWYLEERRSLIRIHQEPRKGDFVPSQRRGCPVDLGKLKSEARSLRHYESGESRMVTRGWRKSEKKAKGPPRNWTGFTEFYLKQNVRIEEVKWHLLANKNTDEVKEESISPEDWPGWRQADAEEWKKVASTDAVRVMSLEESEEVRRQLKECKRESHTAISHCETVETFRATWRGRFEKVKMVCEG